MQLSHRILRLSANFLPNATRRAEATVYVEIALKTYFKVKNWSVET